MLQLFFVRAELLLAIHAAQRQIRRVGESFRMCMIDNLPFDEQNQRGQYQNERERIDEVPVLPFGDDDENEWGEDHREIPVVDAAGRAAAVMHHPCLEWAEEQNADHVRDAIEQGDKHQDALIDDMREIKNPENRV